jgi:hypothetical protein
MRILFHPSAAQDNEWKLEMTSTMSATMTFSTQVQGYALKVEINQGSTNGDALGDVMKHVRKGIELCLEAGQTGRAN